MGGSSWSFEDYASRASSRASAGLDTFAYDRDVKSGVAERKTHPDLDPKTPNKAGQRIREARDSDAHPESLPIAVLFDVTGSMGAVPKTLQHKLGPLMSTLLAKNYADHPQIAFGAIGDATCDRAPLQIGQFESGLEMDDELGKIYIEGGGGGERTESYELAMYYFARHTASDAWEKRGKKGYLFLMGDEMAYPAVSRRLVKEVIGDELQADIPLEAIVAELKEKWEVFFLVVAQGHHGRSPEILKFWRGLFGQNAILLEDASAVAETIALQVGVMENRIFDVSSAGADLVKAGFDPSAVTSATTAVARYAGAAGVARRAEATSTLPGPVLTDDDGIL